MTKNTYRALVASNDTKNADDFKTISCQWVEKNLSPLKPNSVRVHVHYSGINYKDALAVTGRGKILRTLPLTPGIDAAGIVIESTSPHYQKNAKVLITGCGLGESQDGGFSEVVDAPAEWVIGLPQNLSLKDSMTLGTAGFTAALALHQLEWNLIRPTSDAPVLITGATGGVGSMATLLMKKRGYKVEVWTRKKEEFAYLRSLGADIVTDISNIDLKTRPLESGKWVAAIDNVGGDILSYILPRIQPHGSVASIGMAKSPQLNATVFPFILRGVNLLGISSATCPRTLREKVWALINEQTCAWEKALSHTLKPDDIVDYAQQMIAGKTSGRALIEFHPASL